jgi:hypothetical protein
LREGLGRGEPGIVELPAALSASALECLALLEENPGPLLAVSAHSTAGNYLYAHSANVSIVSMHLGLGLGWKRGAVHRLGLAAILHELRLSDMAGLPAEPKDPAAERSMEMTLHPLESREVQGHLRKIEESFRSPLPEAVERASESVPDVVLASHVIGLCDIYETLSRARTWREPLLPHDAVKVILKKFADEFDRRAVHVFLECLTPYPPGSFVKLSTGELACVIGVNPGTPLLPTVAVSVGADGTVPPSQVFIDLSKPKANPVAIQRAVDETKLKTKEGKIVESSRSGRWWIW